MFWLSLMGRLAVNARTRGAQVLLPDRRKALQLGARLSLELANHLAPAPTLGRPCLDQLGRNIGPSVVRATSTVALEKTTAIVQRKIRCLRLLKFRPPLTLERGLLLRGQQAGSPQGGALQVVSRTNAAPFELVIRRRPPAAAPPQPHHEIAVLFPRRPQLLPAAEQ